MHVVLSVVHVLWELPLPSRAAQSHLYLQGSYFCVFRETPAKDPNGWKPTNQVGSKITKGSYTTVPLCQLLFGVITYHSLSVLPSPVLNPRTSLIQNVML